MVLKLYEEFASFYNAYYKQIFDYHDDFLFVNKYLKEKFCRNILEIGCGTGHFAKYLVQHQYKYIGVDNAPKMLDLAHQNVPQGEFREGTFFNFPSLFDKKFDCALMLGRTMPHNTTNTAIFQILRNFVDVLKPGGIVIIDNFNAHKEFVDWKSSMEKIIHVNGRKYKEVNQYKRDMKNGWTFDWHLQYFDITEEETLVFDDMMPIRGFLPEEFGLMLEISGFEILYNQVAKISPYIFRTVAQRKEDRKISWRFEDETLKN